MTTIRPNVLPPSTQAPQSHGPQSQDHGKLAAQRQFFAALGRAQGADAPAVPAAVVVAQAAPTTVSAAPSEAPQKVLRPGSLIDIRV